MYVHLFIIWHLFVIPCFNSAAQEILIEYPVITENNELYNVFAFT